MLSAARGADAPVPHPTSSKLVVLVQGWGWREAVPGEGLVGHGFKKSQEREIPEALSKEGNVL